MNGWKGIFALDKKGKQGNSKTAGNWELLEKIRREEAEHGR